MVQTRAVSGRGGPPGVAEELQEVVRQAYQVPLARDVEESSRTEAAESPGFFDLPEDRFDNLFASGVGGATFASLK